MTKRVMKLVALPTAALLSSLIGLPAWAAPDEGETRATEQYRHLDRCATVVEYGAQPTPIGATTGNAEKDSYAYPVKKTDTVCAAAP